MTYEVKNLEDITSVQTIVDFETTIQLGYNPSELFNNNQRLVIVNK